MTEKQIINCTLQELSFRCRRHIKTDHHRSPRKKRGWEPKEEGRDCLKTLGRLCRKDTPPTLEGYADICQVNQEAFSVTGAMGLLHRKGARESGQITKDFTCSAEAKGRGVVLKSENDMASIQF